MTRKEHDRRRQRAHLLAATVAVVCLGAACVSAQRAPVPGWQDQLAAGLDASDLGDFDAAAEHFRGAREAARRVADTLALGFSTYRLGDLLFRHPHLARGSESAEVTLREALATLEAEYGPGHPVLMPVHARIARLELDRGARAEAAASLAAADAIAVRFFPEHHFLRDRFGTARPALLLHPLEVLRLISAGSWDDLDPDMARSAR